MSKCKIGIVGYGAVSALGDQQEQVWKAFQSAESLIRPHKDLEALVSNLRPEMETSIQFLKTSDKRYSNLDRSVLMAMLAGKSACEAAGWQGGKGCGVNIGSSRGATSLLEQYYEQFSKQPDLRLPPWVSPTTTLGNVSSWVMEYCNLNGVSLSHSVTCSSALHAVANGVAWLEAGRSQRFLVGGTEAPLTPFTIQQMKALRIYAEDEGETYACKPLARDKSCNTMVLGEGAACLCLEKNPEKPLAYINGLGYSTEKISTATAITKDGQGFQGAMQMALKEAGLDTVDVIICHAPGTKKGDQAERIAIEKTFQKNIPFLTSNKWKIGHTLGASGGLSLEMALLMMQYDEVIEVPYLCQPKPNQAIKTVMVNAAGFGGNIVSIILQKALA